MLQNFFLIIWQNKLERFLPECINNKILQTILFQTQHTNIRLTCGSTIFSITKLSKLHSA